jgi:hypothetical protein
MLSAEVARVLPSLFPDVAAGDLARHAARFAHDCGPLSSGA